nr:MAG TPA: Putative amidoligase enzyme [Caudoviricetes sp.]
MAMRTDNRLMKDLTFGCELEFTGITREQAAKVIARFFRAPALYEGAGYDKRIVKDTCGRKWAIMRDSSIRPQRKGGGLAGGDYRVELVTPILYYSDNREKGTR